MKPVLQNILKGYKSTIIGLILMACIILSVFKVEAVTWTDAILPLMVSLMLIFAPRDFRRALIKFISARAGIILWLVGFTALMLSCKTQQPQQQQPTQVHKSWTQATVSNSIPDDSAAVTMDLEQMELEQEYRNQEGRATATVTKGMNGLITGKCDCEGVTRVDTFRLETKTEIPVPYPVRDPKYENNQEATTEGPLWWTLHNIITPLAFIILGLFALLLLAIFLKNVVQNIFASYGKEKGI